MRAGTAWLSAAVLLLLALAGYGAFVALQPQPLAPGVVYGNGHIEAREVRISAQVGGRVLDVPVVEGEPVAADALVARIDDRDLRLQLAQARARQQALRHGAERLRELAETAAHHRRTAQAAVERAEALHEARGLSSQALDQARDALVEARNSAQALQAQEAELAAQQAALDEGVRLLELQLERTRVRSPVAGTVLVRSVEPGELAVPGRPLATVADLDPLELKVYVAEGQLGKLRLGAPARVRVDAFPERVFPAEVARIDSYAQFTPRDIHLPEERTRMVFGVTLRLANPGGYLKPGMPADAWILWQEGAAWPDQLRIPR